MLQLLVLSVIRVCRPYGEQQCCFGSHWQKTYSEAANAPNLQTRKVLEVCGFPQTHSNSLNPRLQPPWNQATNNTVCLSVLRWNCECLKHASYLGGQQHCEDCAAGMIWKVYVDILEWVRESFFLFKTRSAWWYTATDINSGWPQPPLSKSYEGWMFNIKIFH